MAKCKDVIFLLWIVNLLHYHEPNPWNCESGVVVLYEELTVVVKLVTTTTIDPLEVFSHTVSFQFHNTTVCSLYLLFLWFCAWNYFLSGTEEKKNLLQPRITAAVTGFCARRSLTKSSVCLLGGSGSERYRHAASGTVLGGDPFIFVLFIYLWD